MFVIKNPKICLYSCIYLIKSFKKNKSEKRTVSFNNKHETINIQNEEYSNLMKQPTGKEALSAE